jgi:23S rRNA (pseudouridine1915-N3)-methyltransferase
VRWNKERVTIVKFSEISPESWSELQPYLDTCIIPFTGLDGLESPFEATLALERLRDLLDKVENRYRGRVVTYPAFHYVGQDNYDLVNEICHKIKKSGFKYVIIMTADTSLDISQCYNSDLILSQPLLEVMVEDGHLSLSSIIQEMVENLWAGKPMCQM